MEQDLPKELNATQELFQQFVRAFRRVPDGPEQDCSIIFHRDQLSKPSFRIKEVEKSENYLPTMLREIGMLAFADTIESQNIYANKKKKYSKDLFMQALTGDNSTVIKIIGSYYTEVTFKSLRSSCLRPPTGNDPSTLRQWPPQWFRNTCTFYSMSIYHPAAEEEIANDDSHEEITHSEDSGDDIDHTSNDIIDRTKQVTLLSALKSPPHTRISCSDLRCAMEGASAVVEEDAFDMIESIGSLKSPQEYSVSNVLGEPHRAPLSQLLENQGHAIKTPSGRTKEVLKTMYPKSCTQL